MKQWHSIENILTKNKHGNQEIWSQCDLTRIQWLFKYCSFNQYKSFIDVCWYSWFSVSLSLFRWYWIVQLIFKFQQVLVVAISTLTKRIMKQTSYYEWIIIGRIIVIAKDMIFDLMEIILLFFFWKKQKKTKKRETLNKKSKITTKTEHEALIILNMLNK